MCPDRQGGEVESPRPVDERVAAAGVGHAVGGEIWIGGHALGNAVVEEFETVQDGVAGCRGCGPGAHALEHAAAVFEGNFAAEEAFGAG